MNLINRNPGIVVIYSCLFLTVASILSNETTRATSADERVDNELTWSVQPIRENVMEEKEVNIRQFPITYTSSNRIEPTQPNLEDVIDFEQYSKTNVVATGYTAGKESTGKTSDHPAYGITYSGVEVTRDLYSTIAADLDIFPIGTILYIPSYGYGVVADIGSAIKGNRLDLYYDTVSDVYKEWGKRELDVYVIQIGEGELTEDMLAELNEDEAMQVFRTQFISDQ